MKQAIIGLTVLLLGLGGLAGCGSPSASTAHTSTHRLSAVATSTAPSGTANACQSLATIHTSIATLATKAKSMTVGQVKAAQQKIATAAGNLEAKIPNTDVNTDAPALNNLKDANTNLTNVLSGYPDSTPMSEVLPAQPGYAGFVARMQAAQGTLSSKLGCSA